jgi:ferredoxin-NADP reductase
MAILRQLHKENRLAGNHLIFSNKTSADIIRQEELKNMLGDNCIFTLTDRPEEGYESGFVNEDFLQEKIKDFSVHFYICGPDRMISDLSATLERLGASPDAVVFER